MITFEGFQSPKGRLQTRRIVSEIRKRICRFQSPKGRLQTLDKGGDDAI